MQGPEKVYHLHILCPRLVEVGGGSILIGKLTGEGIENVIERPIRFARGLRALRNQTRRPLEVEGNELELLILGYVSIGRDPGEVMQEARDYLLLCEKYLPFLNTCVVLTERPNALPRAATG